MNACQQAAAESSWNRHVAQALRLLTPQTPGVRVLALTDGRDDMRAPSAAHPASRAIRTRRGSRG